MLEPKMYEENATRASASRQSLEATARQEYLNQASRCACVCIVLHRIKHQMTCKPHNNVSMGRESLNSNSFLRFLNFGST
mmetsp:Transcript_13304/g.28752  ORF Transcript_13304/g.28752 Transcript_13304/m.28752 type:complete len:80 (-) Transcript_13304:54-293(-)